MIEFGQGYQQGHHAVDSEARPCSSFGLSVNARGIDLNLIRSSIYQFCMTQY